MTRTNRPTPRSIRFSLIKWELAAIVVVMVIILAAVLFSSEEPRNGVSPYLVYGSLLALSLLLAYFWHLHWRRLHDLLLQTEGDLQRTRRRMTAAMRLSHQFVEARSEEEIIRAVLRTSREVIGAGAATFVPINERGKPYPAVSDGDLPEEILRDWAEHLAEPEIRRTCARCRGEVDVARPDCPLYDAPSRDLALVQCLPARRNGQELGILNLYLEPGAVLPSEDGAFLQAILNEMAIALEAVRLRERELSVLRTVRRLDDSQQALLLQRLLEGLAQTVEAEFAVLIGAGLAGGSTQESIACGNISSGLLVSLQGLMETLAWDADRPRLLRESELRNLGIEDVYSLGLVPVPGPGAVIHRSVLVGRNRPPALDLSRFAFLEGLTEVLGMALQLGGLAGELTYQATMDERARLAREIHDGLAQTLGFLKLTVAQIEGYVDRGEQAKIRPALQACHTSLREAYADARQAIDDLRGSTQLGFVTWVDQVAGELRELDGFTVHCQGLESVPGLSPEAESQLIRIVQEALTNIRKHAAATEISIRLSETGGAWLLEIEDDGRGYDVRDMFGASSHGLVGMRERAELIDAELQLDSAPGQGTRVQIRLPDIEPVNAP